MYFCMRDACRQSCPKALDRVPCAVQSGNLDYHRKSLSNLGEAMKKSRRLCGIMVDTVGRELTIRRPHDLDETVIIVKVWRSMSSHVRASKLLLSVGSGLP